MGPSGASPRRVLRTQLVEFTVTSHLQKLRSGEIKIATPARAQSEADEICGEMRTSDKFVSQARRGTMGDCASREAIQDLRK